MPMLELNIMNKIQISIPFSKKKRLGVYLKHLKPNNWEFYIHRTERVVVLDMQNTKYNGANISSLI